MRIENYSEDKLKKEILEIVGRFLDLEKYRVFFFGSRVEGRGNERSDIDIGIEGPEKIPGYILYQIKEEIEEKIPVLYKFDIVDFKNCDKDFKKRALLNIEYLN